MKKSLIKTCLLLCFVLIISFCASCNKKCKNHEFVNGICSKCEEVDPDYIPPHVHNFVEGKCECGEKDPDYIPPHVHNFFYGECSCGMFDPNHTHVFVGGICVCGEEDPNYNDHKHEFIEGECECGEKDPNYVENYNIKYVLNGGSVSNAPSNYDGSVTITLPTPTHDELDFGGWYDNPEFSGSPITEIPVGAKGDKVFYSKWECNLNCEFGKTYNRFNFDGNGMTFGIKVPLLSNYDPFNENYSLDDKVLRQAQQQLVESEFNIKINYSEYSSDGQWGINRTYNIKYSHIDSSFRKNNVYSVVINSSWIPDLVKADCLVELYNIYEEDGLFNDLEIDQDYFVNELLSVRNKVYGYNTKAIQPEFLIYYNVDKVRELGLEDPTELWFKGEWNYTKFESWIKDASSKLSEGEYVIDSLHGDYAIGMTAAQGNKICDIYRKRILFKENGVCSILEKMKTYHNDGLWNENKGYQDITNKFKEGGSLLQNGRLYFYINGYFDDLEFNLGIVPYPSDDNTNISLYLEPYEYENQNKEKVLVDTPIKSRNGDVLATSNGEEIYGINLSESNYQCPITSVDECYAIMNYNYEEIGSISETVVLAIINALSSYNYNEFDYLYYEDIYDEYYSEIDKAAISSVINGAYVYYEPIESLSFTIWRGDYHRSSWWELCLEAMKSEETVKEFLDECETPFQEELKSFYNI